jgi:hypothetical protein
MTRSLTAQFLRCFAFIALLIPSLATAQQAGQPDNDPYTLAEPPDSLLQAIASLPQPQRSEILQAFRFATGVTIRDFVNPTCMAYSFWKWRRAHPGPPAADFQQLFVQWGGDWACLDPEIIARSHSTAASRAVSQEPGMTAARRQAIGACVGEAMVKAAMEMTPPNLTWLQGRRYVQMITDCKQKHPASAA